MTIKRKDISPPPSITASPTTMTMESQVRPPTMIEDNELPAYSAVDESPVLIPRQSVDADTLPYRDPIPSPAFAAAAAYPTAEEEKAQVRASLMSGDAAAAAVDGHLHAHPGTIPANLNTTTFSQQPFDGSSAGQNASATALSRGLQVPSFSRFVSSGFPYPDVLASYQITPADWARFTSEITQAAHMTSADWAVAIGGGTGTFLLAGLVIAWWGVIPAYFVGRSIQRKRETENLAQARNTGELEQKLLKWNQDFFAPKGVLIRLDLPGESHDIGNMDVHTRKWSHCQKRWEEGARKMNGLIDERKLAKLQHKMERKMEKDTRKTCRKEGKVKRKAIKKGRIVILPLNRNGNTMSPAVAAAVVPDIGNLSISGRTENDLYASSQG